MRGYLPSQSDESKQPPRTSLLVRWLPSDHVLLDALRPFKARARGRRFKELATLGAELERRGFRLEASGDGYRLMLPADLSSGLDLRVAPLPSPVQPPQLPPTASNSPSVATVTGSTQLPASSVPSLPHARTGESSTVDRIEPAEIPSAPVIDDDTLEFAAAFG